MSKVKMTNGERTISVDEARVSEYKNTDYRLVDAGKVKMKPVVEEQPDEKENE